jgi:long-chain acyl-CoA synthetase
VCALPLYHILALNACMLMGARWGAMNLLVPNPRDMAGFVKELARYRVNFFPGVNTLFNALLNQPGLAKVDFSGLRITLGGGMAVQQVVSERWLKLTGSPILEGYGLSETSPTATLCRPRWRYSTTTASRCRSGSPARSRSAARR